MGSARMHTTVPAKWCLSGCLGLISQPGVNISRPTILHRITVGYKELPTPNEWVGTFTKMVATVSFCIYTPWLCGPLMPSLQRESVFHWLRFQLCDCLATMMKEPHTSSKRWLGGAWHIPWPSKRKAQVSFVGSAPIRVNTHQARLSPSQVSR